MANAAERPEAGSRNGDPGSEEMRRLAAQESARRERQRQSLNLQREHILSQRTSHPARRAALEAALAQIESQLNAIS